MSILEGERFSKDQNDHEKDIIIAHLRYELNALKIHIKQMNEVLRMNGITNLAYQDTAKPPYIETSKKEYP